MDKYDEIQQLREDYEAILDDAESRRAAYHQAIRKAYLAGASLADLAHRLGISRQRVHEIVGKEPAARRQRRKRRVVGSAIISVATILIGTAAWALIDYDRPHARPQTPPTSECGRPIGQPCRAWRYLLAYDTRTGSVAWTAGHPANQRSGFVAQPHQVVIDISGRTDVYRVRHYPDQYHVDLATGSIVREYTQLHLALALTGVFLVGAVAFVVWNRRHRFGRAQAVSFTSV
jgi:hypothetical protein